MFRVKGGSCVVPVSAPVAPPVATAPVVASAAGICWVAAGVAAARNAMAAGSVEREIEDVLRVVPHTLHILHDRHVDEHGRSVDAAEDAGVHHQLAPDLAFQAVHLLVRIA
jgi:hypothetical protein